MRRDYINVEAYEAIEIDMLNDMSLVEMPVILDISFLETFIVLTS